MQPDRLLSIEPHLLRRALLPGAGSVPHDVRTSFHLPRSQSQHPPKNHNKRPKQVKKKQLTPLPSPQRSLRPRAQQLPLRRPLRLPRPL